MTTLLCYIDWSLCLSRCNNNADVATTLLDLLASELPSLKSSIQLAYQQKNLETLLDLTHKLNGACACSGALLLNTTAGTIEHQILTTKQLPEQQQIESLMVEINETLEIINTKAFLK
jgi:two-component system, NarL family, sensor histidine kinase BarA